MLFRQVTCTIGAGAGTGHDVTLVVGGQTTALQSIFDYPKPQVRTHLAISSLRFHIVLFDRCTPQLPSNSPASVANLRSRAPALVRLKVALLRALVPSFSTTSLHPPAVCSHGMTRA